jgi:hypothetical protein
MVKVVEKALEKEPEQRWQSAEEMADALEQALEAGPRTLGGGEAVMRRVERDAQAKLGRIAVAVVIGLAAIAVGAFIVLQPRAGGDGVRRSTTRGNGVTAVVVPAEATLEVTIAQASTDSAAGATGFASPEPVAAGAAGAPPARTPGVAGSASAPAGAARANAEANTPEATTELAAAAPPGSPARGLDAAQLSAELVRHDSALQRCHQDVVVAALMRSPQGSDLPELGVLELDVALRVAASGQVRSADVTGNAPESLRRCVADVARSFSFPRAERESEARVPIVFTPNVVRQ